MSSPFPTEQRLDRLEEEITELKDQVDILQQRIHNLESSPEKEE